MGVGISTGGRGSELVSPDNRRLEEAGINFSAERAMEALQTVRLVTFRMDDRPERRGVSGGCPDARRVLKALKLTELKPPTPPEGEETVM